MNQGCIRTGRRREDPTPHHIFSDHDWLRQHEEELIKQYGECHMIIYQGKVLSTGATEDEAIENAERNLPPEHEPIEVMVEWVGHRNPFLRAYPVPPNGETI